jgi:hypothetical protein
MPPFPGNNSNYERYPASPKGFWIIRIVIGGNDLLFRKIIYNINYFQVARNMEFRSKDIKKKILLANIIIFILIFMITFGLLIDAKSQAWPPTQGVWRTSGIDGGDHGGSISIKLDSNDFPHMIYTSSSIEGLDLKYASWDDNFWNYNTIASSEEWESFHMSFALDNNDNPHISYYFNGLIYTTLNGSGWDNETIDNNGGRFNSITIDSNNYPHIVYHGDGGLIYSSFDGNSWTVENIDNACDSTSLDLDSNDYPHIAYKYGSEIKYARWNGNSWDLKTVAKNAWGPSIAIDSHNRPHISYAKELEIHITRWTGDSWEKELVDSRESRYGHVDGMTSIALDENDNEYLSYICGCTLRFAKKYNGAWIPEVLFSTGGLSSSSIDVDSHEGVHIGNNLDRQIRYIVNVEYDSDGDGVPDSEDFLPEFNNYVFFTVLPSIILIISIIILIIISRKKIKNEENENSEDEDSEEVID